MPRTFSLSQLILGVTWLCFVCGLAVSRNEQAIAYLLTMVCFIPAAIIGFILATFSQHRMTMVIVTLAGGAVGIFWTLSAFQGGQSMTVWQVIPRLFLPMAVGGAMGAVVFGVITLVMIAISPVHHGT